MRIPVPLGEAQKTIRDGDLLLWRGGGLIPILGRGIHRHAGMAAWWDGDLFCLDVVEWVGGRAVSLRRQVERAPGRIDVFEANADGQWPQFNRAGAVRFMRQFAGCDYGWWNLLLVGLLHLPGIRLLLRAETDDRANGRRPPFCSQAVAAAVRVGGGVDPVRFLADRLTEPADLARSPFYRYRFTLMP